MLNIRDIRINPASPGEKKLLVDIIPVYEYKDKQRTDTIAGCRYIVAPPDGKGAYHCPLYHRISQSQNDETEKPWQPIYKHENGS